jgi:putative tricarboxylic transport membrane protein
VKVLQIPRPLLYAGILMFAALGAFATHFTRDDVLLLLAIGLLSFFMRRYGYPVAPMVIGVILGPIFEKQLRTALTISAGDYSTLVESPFAVAVYVILAVLLVVSAVIRRREQKLEHDLAEVAS